MIPFLHEHDEMNEAQEKYFFSGGKVSFQKENVYLFPDGYFFVKHLSIFIYCLRAIADSFKVLEKRLGQILVHF